MSKVLASPNEPKFPLRDKTLVVWVTPADVTGRGGSVLTLENPEGQFDGVVFGEVHAKKWMAGSERFSRTERNQDTYPDETADTTVQVAVVYQEKETCIYRNGEEYARYTIENEPASFSAESLVLMGQRLQHPGAFFSGTIEDARIYATALTAEQIAGLKPKEPSTPQPLAWWDFRNNRTDDRMGEFRQSRLIGDAQVTDEKLVLPEGGSALIAGGEADPKIGWIAERAKTAVPTPMIDASRQLRLRMLADPHRPTYHFVIPEDFGMPFDPNGTVFWNGRYHLGYIYQDNGVHYWGHASSRDLLHWRHHPPCLFPTEDSPEKGIFSGNCFINKQGEATMLYHGVGVGNCIATSAEKNLDHWKKLPANPIIPSPKEGDPDFGRYASWDPHGWLEGDTYYGIFGGTTPAIFRATELDQWEYVGDLLAHALPGVDIHEDISCPDLFRLGEKYVLVCISHRLGCRYYIGEWKDEQFYPEFHEQMSWVDNAFFAPESFEDDKGRRIMWAWIFDGRAGLNRLMSGWSGTMSLPRVLWLDAHNRLRMRPVEELESLRYNERTLESLTVKADSERVLEAVEGNTIELVIEMVPYAAKQCGVKVCCSPDGEEQTVIYYDASEKQLKVDTRRSSLWEGPKSIESGPFELSPGEVLKLRVFVDRSVVEVFANDRQAVMRRIYPTRADSVNVSLFSNGGATWVKSARAWEMMPSNPY